ncbi:hypothetical protein BY458DRAFT_500010 [Sporodiniella umbellata]|nr:hypothetical protein BY458DRAFT_500010 [Sporodiniella umbellata]
MAHKKISYKFLSFSLYSLSRFLTFYSLFLSLSCFSLLSLSAPFFSFCLSFFQFFLFIYRKPPFLVSRLITVNVYLY